MQLYLTNMQFQCYARTVQVCLKLHFLSDLVSHLGWYTLASVTSKAVVVLEGSTASAVVPQPAGRWHPVRPPGG